MHERTRDWSYDGWKNAVGGVHLKSEGPVGALARYTRVEDVDTEMQSRVASCRHRHTVPAEVLVVLSPIINNKN